MRRAARAIPLLAVLAVAAAGPLPVGAQTPAPPQITLLTPANGALVQGNPTFTWRVDWPQGPPSGTVILVHKIANDPGLTQNLTVSTYGCPATDLSACTSHRVNATYKGRYYWQVSMVGAAEGTSATFMFTAAEPPPAVDRIKPYVRTFSGSARRGTRAHFSAQVRDNTGEVRMRALLTYRGLPVLEGRTQFAPVTWRVKQRFYSIRPLSRRLPRGIYKICITAWDRAGNQGRSCARYRVR